MDHRWRWEMRIHKYESPWILVLCFWRRYPWISTLRDTYNALVFAQKYVNAEAASLFIIIFECAIVFCASALTYFCAKISSLYVSWSVDIQAYLLQKQGTSIHGVACLWILMSHLLRWSMVDYVFTAQKLGSLLRF